MVPSLCNIKSSSVFMHSKKTVWPLEDEAERLF